MRSQVSGIECSRLPGRKAVSEVRKGGRRTRKASNRAQKRRECTNLALDLGEREEQVVCHASALTLAMTDEARREVEM